jgi:acetylornithine deacetylase/succinyl-diaminopimelate desuccinylase-like protein
MNDPVILTKKLISIESISGNESEIASFMVDWFESNGLSARIVEDTNVVCSLGKKPYTLLFNSHMDTVPPSGSAGLNPVEKNGKIIGRGASDSKSSLACMMIAMKELADKGVEGVIFTGVSGEELAKTDAKGTYKLVKKGLKAKFAVLGEPSVGYYGDRFAIGIGSRGRLEIVLRAKGSEVSTSGEKKGSNAIILMAQAIERIVSMPRHQCRVCDGVVVEDDITISEIHSNSIANNVQPNECVAHVDARITPCVLPESFYKRIKQLLPEGVDAELAYVSYPSYVGENTTIEKIASQCIERLCGYSPKRVFKLGHTDADYLINLAHIPTIIIGPGEAGASHSDSEWVSISRIMECKDIYVCIGESLSINGSDVV